MTRPILCVCGGTGGHIYPALAIADALRAQGCGNICFAGRIGSMEERLVADKWPFHATSAVPLRRGSVRENLSLPARLSASVLKAYRLLRRLKPRAVVATGGYVALPVMLAAAWLGIPLYIQEQNAVAGIANRIGARWARKVFVTSEDAARMFGKARTEIMGNPIRALPSSESLTVPAEFAGRAYKVLVLGGSQGAQGINKKIAEILPRIAQRQDMSLVWQAGEKNVEFIRTHHAIPANVHLRGFLPDVYAYLNYADVVISRAGASTLAEILAFAKPAVLMPYPFATANHQEHNARVLEKAGAAWVELDGEPNQLWEKIVKLIEDSNTRHHMGQKARELAQPDAAERIARRILQEVGV